MTDAPMLPPLGRDHPPAFTNATTCREWLTHLPLVSPVQAQATLLAQTNILNRFALPPLERLRILETLREPVQFVTGESARKFASRGLPLVPQEQSVFEANVQLLRALATGYHHCLEACRRREEGAGHAPIAAERALAAMAAEQYSSYLTATHLAPDFWRRLNRLYSVAEQLGAAESELSDPLFDRGPVSARAVYAHVLLFQRASPHELSTRQLALVHAWIARWCSLIGLSAAAPQAAKLPPLVVDVRGETHALTVSPTGGELRWLDVTPLAGKLKRRISELQGGATPESLQLGENCRQPACEQLLRHVYEHCCKAGIARAQTRRSAQGECRLAGGLEAAFYYVSGAPFRQPATGAQLTKRQVDEIATFGRISTRDDEHFAEQLGFRAEAWEMTDDSPAGMRLYRPVAAGSGRIARGQLIAVALPGTQGYLLAAARWIMRDEKDVLHLGARLLPGTPQAVVARPAGSAHVRDKWCPGFLLPPVVALQALPSILLPAGWHRMGRSIDIWDTPRRTLRCGSLIERGFDFDRVAYEPA